ncbi:nuclear pore complex subunit [Dimargaris verticillata]|uniref:Nuclear pore protein n=1 Tax=Dimargaris verticillata TaxID=2761393 RepID=A0A9W8BA29_9FUNG|nr:nuclear pore complex subunit [Dimargaris verticillata]
MVQSNPNRLKQLLEDSQRLTSHIAASDVPSLQRGLDQLESDSKRLVSRSILDNPGLDPQSHLLLTSGGVDPERLTQAAHKFNLSAAFEPVQSIPDTDVDGFLQYQREQLIINAIESGYRETCQDFEQASERALRADWQRAKNRLLEELGQHPVGGSVGAQATVGRHDDGLEPGTTAGMFRRRARSTSSLQLNPRMLRYATAVRDLNDRRLGRHRCTVVNLFEHVAEQLTGDDKAHQVVACWRLLATLLDERPEAAGVLADHELHEAEFRDAYTNASYASPASVQVRNHFIQGAQTYLQDQFMQYIDKTLAQFPHEAHMGGVPSVHNKIRAYLNIKLNRNASLQAQLEKDQDQAVWAHLYYLFRVGRIPDALEYAMQHETFLVRSERNFLTYLKAFVDDEDHRLPKTLRDRIHADFNRYTRNTHDGVDPFKFALMKIIGRCELGRKSVSEVIQATEDYVWLQLALIRESATGEEHPDDQYSLRDLQRLLTRFGPNHFNPNGSNPILYFQVLLLSAQFEQAINFLLQHESYRVEAVHFAIALAYYGLIRPTPLNLQMGALDYLTVAPDTEGVEMDYLNVNRIVTDYTYRFSAKDCGDALQYVLLLCLPGLLNPTQPDRAQYQRNLCHEALLALILDSGDFVGLLGDINRDGTRTPGLLEQYKSLIPGDDGDYHHGHPPTSDLLIRITKQAAERCHQDGRLADAIMLFNMAEEYDTVVVVMVRQLGEILSNPAERYQIAKGSSEASGMDSSNADSSAGVPRGALRLGLTALTNLSAPEVKRMAEKILGYYMQQPHIQTTIQPKHRETCSLLIRLLDFMAAYEADRVEVALTIIEKLNLIPLDADVATITRQAEQLRDMDEAVARNFPDILLATMDVLYRLYSQTKQSQFLDATKHAQLQQLQRKARSVMVLAGMVQFRMPADTYSRLNRLEVFMN